MYGEYQHVIDSKGRMFLPAKFRSKLGDQVYLAKVLDRCINIFSDSSFHEFMKKIEDHPTEITVGRAMKRKISSSVSVIDVDAQGRVLISPKLREQAGLSKNVIVVGMGDRVEIWDPETYEAVLAGVDDENIEDAMRELGM